MYEDLIEWMRYCADDKPICEKMEDCPFYDESENNSAYYLCGERMLKKAADAIEELQLYMDLYKDLTEKGEKIAREVIDKYPKWIPVTERLPKENGFYLCLYKYKASNGVAMNDGLSILQWINNKWGINDIYLVTHWMPLPEPPKDGEA